MHADRIYRASRVSIKFLTTASEAPANGNKITAVSSNNAVLMLPTEDFVTRLLSMLTTVQT